MLVPSEISVKNVYEKYDNLENRVRTSLINGETKYLIPASVNNFANYAFPDRMEQVRGTIAWNAMEPKNSIQPPESVNLIKLSTANKNLTFTKLVDKKTKQIETDIEFYDRIKRTIDAEPKFALLREKYPDKYKALLSAVYGVGNPKLDECITYPDKGFGVIAIPKDIEKIPDYLIPLMNTEEMVTRNTSAGNTLLGAIGIYTDGGNSKSNIIKL